MSTTAVRSPAEFEEQIQRYLYERSEEGRAVRVGEKEVSEQAAIVARYADLFSREQLRALRDEEDRADDDQREWLYRLRKTCESGLLAAELADRDDELENAILAARIEFKGEQMPLRTAQAKLAVLDGYADRQELGEIYHDASTLFNDQRLELHEGARHGRLPRDRVSARVRHGDHDHPARPRRPAAEGAARLRDRVRPAESRAPDHASAGRPARLSGISARGRPRAALRERR